MNNGAQLAMIRRIRIYLINQFGFSRTESNGIIILFLVVSLSFILPKVYFNSIKSSATISNQPSLAEWNEDISASIAPKETNPVLAHSNDESEPIKKFQFNPNTATKEALKTLGFSDVISQRILNYRQSGGQFRIKEDLYRIYGIDSAFLQSLESYIDLPVDLVVERPEASVPAKHDLNSATPMALQKIKGIGPVLSERIVKYRDLVGGFHNFDQLKEVYNLPDSIAAKISGRFFIGPGSFSLIDINSDSIRGLAKHPYINYNMAKAIVRYREVHGLYQSVDDLKKIKIISDSTFDKISPYLGPIGTP